MVFQKLRVLFCFSPIEYERSSWYDNEDLEEYDPDVNWYPKLFVENAIYDKYYEDISYRLHKIDGKTMITETRVCKGKHLHLHSSRERER